MVNIEKHDWLEALYLLSECEKILNSIINESELPEYYKDLELDAFIEEYGIPHLQLVVQEFLKIQKRRKEEDEEEACY